MAERSRKIVIIGAGIAGLCTAIYARKCGYEVEVLEQHNLPGGLATSWQRGGYTFETCLHWLLGSKPGAVLHSQWQEVFDIDKLRFVNPEEYVRVETERGESLRVYSNVDRLEAELLEKSPEDAKDIRLLTADVRKLANFPMPDPTEEWPGKWLNLLRTVPYLPSLKRWSRITAEEYSKRLSNPLLTAFFGGGDTAKLAMLPLVFSMAWMSQQNAGYPIGGSQAIIQLIVERLTQLGGRLRLGAKVQKILVENDRAVGVQLAGAEVVAADWVISAADGHATIYDMLGGRYKDEKIEKIYHTFEVFPSYLQVSLGVARDLSQHAGFVTRVLNDPITIDPATSLKQVSFRFFHFDPTFAPSGKTAVTCFLPTRNFEHWVSLQRDPVKYKAEKGRVSETVIGILEKSVPDLRRNIEVTDVSTPATVIQFTGNWKGSMEGWLLTPRTGFKALPSTLPGLAQFMMVGQWVMPGGGLPSGLMTARAAIQAVSKHDRVPFPTGGRANPKIATGAHLAKAS